MNILIGMETSGMLRRRFQARGHFVVSVDLLPADDKHKFSKTTGGHIQGDLFEVFHRLRKDGIVFDLGIFHPDCTYLTSSAEWAFADPDFKRYPGVGYHQKVKPGTLTGARRRAARQEALSLVYAITKLPIKRKAIENPKGAITKVIPFKGSLLQPVYVQTIQPNQFGDDASKGTVLILINLPPLRLNKKRARPRMVCSCGVTYPFDEMPVRCKCGAPSKRMAPRYANQTDSGQNNLRQSADRWKQRAKTYSGIADAMVERWG